MPDRFKPILALAFLAAMHDATAVTVDFPVVQDTWANSNKPTRNYGSQSTMTIRSGDVKIPYLQIQTYGITGAITSATLNFRITGDTGTLSAHAVSPQTWDESTLTFDFKPAWNATAAGNTTFTTTGWKSIDVTSAISGNDLFSFALLSTNLINAGINSRESAYAPYLQVIYEDVNLPPTATPESYNVLHDTLRTVGAPGLLANDSDPNHDPLATQLETGTAHGTLNLAADGSFTYLPAPGFSGTDSFTYRAVDNHGPGDSLASGPVTVTLLVSASSGQFTADELARFQQDLGVTLSVDQQLELGAIVKPLPGEAWRDAADARIDQHRKADLTVTVTDTNGTPLQGAEVTVRLKRKAFRFGGILDLNEFSLGAAGGVDASTYRAIAPAYFDAVGLNNGLKPKLSATNATNLARLTDEFFPWCAANNLPARGHLLIWPGGTHMSASVDAKVTEIEDTDTPTQTQLDDLRALVDAEISSWTAQWDVYEWDVLNESIGNHRIQDILGQIEIVRWFELANTARPGSGRLINEYQIISGNNEGRFPAYKAQIQLLLDNAAPITAIGFQSRFKFKHEDPAVIYSRLEQFTTYNKDLVGTEFEIIPSPDGTFVPDETLRAEMTEEVMTTYFSHPKVTGLHAWEYLSDESSALVANDGSPKLNGLVWYYLNRLRYDTRATLVTDSQGQVNLRAFKGDYEITVDTGGIPVSEEHILNADSVIQIGTNVSTSTIHTLDVLEDTFAQEANPDNTSNFQTIQLRNPDGSVGRIGYLKFDLSQVSGTIVGVKLRLYDIAEPHAIDVMTVADNSWAENTLTWNNRPATGAVIGNGTAPDPLPALFDIALDPAAITAGGTLSLALNETGNSYGTVASSENTSDYPIPQLIITTGTPDTDNDGILDTLDPDDDNDGLPDDWEILHGLLPLDPTDGTIDSDKDGISNLIEFALALDPTVSDSLSGSFRIEVTTAGSYHIVFRRRTGSHARPVTLQYSGGLNGWTAVDLSDLPGAGFTLFDQTILSSSDASGTIETIDSEIQFEPAGSPRFFRLMVE